MTNHLNREQLLNYLDGELSRAGMRSAGEHIQSCWACRTELEHLQADIGLIHDAHKNMLLPALPPPPQPWPRLEPRLASVRRPGWLHLLRVAVTFHLARHPVPLLTVLAGLVAAVAVFWFNPQSVSAKEIIRRVAEADARRMTVPQDHFIRQTVQVIRSRRGSTSKETGQIDSWRSAKSVYWRIAQTDTVARSLQQRYQTGKVADLPLSSVSYQSWSKDTATEGTVTRAANTLAVQFVAVKATGPENLESVGLVVRPSDWRVTQMELDFADGRFEITEENMTVLSRSEVPVEVLSELEPAVHKREPIALAAKTVAPTSPAPPPVSNLDDVEIDVRYMLHEIGADLGEPIEVARDTSGQLVVRAWAIPRARKEILKQLLQDKTGVRLELEPSAHTTFLTPAFLTSEPSPVADTARRPDKERLAKWFGSSKAQEDFTRSVLISSTDLLAHLYALEQLDDRWPPESASLLSDESREKLATMIQENARSAAQRCTELKLIVKPLLDDFAATGEDDLAVSATYRAQDPAMGALESGKEVDRLLRSLFTTTAQTTSLDDGLPRIRESLEELARRIAALTPSKL